MIVLSDVDMKQYSNMRVGGIAKEFIFIEKEEEINEVITSHPRCVLLGNGTNTLIQDGYLDVTFVSLKKLDGLKRLDETRVYVEAGKDLSDFIDYMRDEDLGGLENITGIPGSIGGLVVMNGGAYGTTVFDRIESVRVYSKDFGIKDLKKDEIELDYRTTAIKRGGWIVIGATFLLKKGFNSQLSDEKISKRKERHPLEYPNLGSTFKNPTGHFAARLISNCNLQGCRVGNIEVSCKHPNFLVNRGGAKFDDVIALIHHIQLVVATKTGINLEPEILIVKV